jgi:hypothetical protein
MWQPDSEINMVKLSARDLKTLLNFYLASEDGVDELRFSEQMDRELSLLIAQKFIVRTSEPSSVYGYTSGYTLTKPGKTAVEAAIDAINKVI